MGEAELPERWTSASEILQRIRRGECSAVEVTSDAVERIHALNPVYGAATFLSEEEAVSAATALDQRLARCEPVGSLAGIPTLMKDLYGFRPGWPTTLGGLPAALEDSAPDGVWSRYPLQVLRHDGILIGQTNSSTFGFRGVTDNTCFGPTRNPFDAGRNAGGSSGGSAAAVGSGMVPIAGASDAGGSIRIPAAWTNTFGFQASAGRVPSSPRPSLYHLGPHLYEGAVTRTVEDGLLAFNALQGFDPHDPYSTPESPISSRVLTAGVVGKRMGLSLDFGGFPVEPSIADRIERAAETFESLGAIVEPVTLNLSHPHDELTQMWLRAMGTLMAADVDGFAARGVSPDELGAPEAVLQWVEVARRMAFDEIVRDRVMRTAVLDCFIEATEHFDLLLGPTVTSMPVSNRTDGETAGPTTIEGHAVDPLIGWCPTYLTNFTGFPSASVPTGLVDGLPVGMLIVGKKFQDASVFAAAAAFEEARPWFGNYSLVG
ncbi:amidase [Leucobacter sp. Z1108]|uniref:amidase n=1 Tax=Leucobacter sp. Z1108 TaxID=3439066 RepID=UPI000EDD2BF1|nr:amidase [Actinomycetota bacterium]